MDPDRLSDLVAVARFSSGDTLIAMTLVAYDFLLMFPKEVDYIWKARWTPGKVLFLIIRYLPFVDLPLWPFDDAMLDYSSPLSCNFAEYWVLVSLLLSDVLAGIVYGLRTWALWNRSRVMGVFLILCWIGIYVGVAVYETVFQSAVPDEKIPGLTGCFFLSSPSDSTWEAYLFATIYQIIIFLATVVKGIQHLRYEPARLTSVLYRDAFLAALAQLCINMANIIIMRATHQPSWALNATFRALTSILPARIILNIREAATTLDGWDVTFAPQDSTLTLNAATSAGSFAPRAESGHELEDMPEAIMAQPSPA